jgi:hypothetical protein
MTLAACAVGFVACGLGHGDVGNPCHFPGLIDPRLFHAGRILKVSSPANLDVAFQTGNQQFLLVEVLHLTANGGQLHAQNAILGLRAGQQGLLISRAYHAEANHA